MQIEVIDFEQNTLIFRKLKISKNKVIQYLKVHRSWKASKSHEFNFFQNYKHVSFKYAHSRQRAMSRQKKNAQCFFLKTLSTFQNNHVHLKNKHYLFQDALYFFCQ